MLPRPTVRRFAGGDESRVRDHADGMRGHWISFIHKRSLGYPNILRRTVFLVFRWLWESDERVTSGCSGME